MLRAIAFLVRDENWGTFTPTIEDLRIDESGDELRGRPTAEPAPTPRARWSTTRGSPASRDGSLDFEVVAEPRTDVLTNRTGFIVLHPADVAGQPVKILHVDGREEQSRFPEPIDPACPFRDIRAVSHEIAPGAWATCTMEGDAFEMEDQRNWSDASYKTYVRPLTRPWPYTLPKGEPVAQAVRLAISGPAPPAGRARRPTARSGSRSAARAARLPAIGIGVPARRGGARAARPAVSSSGSRRDGWPARSTCAGTTGGRNSSATAPSPI